MKVTKEAMERMCRAAGMQPQKRATIRGKDVFIADGFSSPPHASFHRFGLEKEEFPFGCFVTMWFTDTTKSEIGKGRPLYFDALQASSRNQTARIAEAIKDATANIKDDEKAKKH